MKNRLWTWKDDEWLIELKPVSFYHDQNELKSHHLLSMTYMGYVNLTQIRSREGVNKIQINK